MSEELKAYHWHNIEYEKLKAERDALKEEVERLRAVLWEYASEENWMKNNASWHDLWGENRDGWIRAKRALESR